MKDKAFPADKITLIKIDSKRKPGLLVATDRAIPLLELRQKGGWVDTKSPRCEDSRQERGKRFGAVAYRFTILAQR